MRNWAQNQRRGDRCNVLGLSSTAIVIEVLSNQRRLATATGRKSFGPLFQDLAVVPILPLVSILGANIEGSLVAALLWLWGRRRFAVVLIVVASGGLRCGPVPACCVEPRLERSLRRHLFVIVGTGVAAGLAGLIDAARRIRIAGLLLAETEFRKAI
jgi:CPA2 family monovalent cation:H+ antiporter-2